MTVKQALSILFKYPVAVLLDGIRAQREKYHRAQIEAQYGIRQLPTIDLLDLLPGLEGQLNTYSFLDGTSSITDLILLKSLAKTYASCSYLEIGSWRGESIVNVADIAPKCTSVTLSKSEMQQMNLNPEFIRLHGFFSENHPNITTIGHNSHTFDFQSLDQSYDLIFVDGDHGYESVKKDSQSVFPLRRNEGSIIVWHDYGFNPESVRYSVLHGILDGIPREKHQHLYHVSNTMCAIYLEDKNFNTYLPQFPTTPNKVFSIHLTTKRLD